MFRGSAYLMGIMDTMSSCWCYYGCHLESSALIFRLISIPSILCLCVLVRFIYAQLSIFSTALQQLSRRRQGILQQWH